MKKRILVWAGGLLLLAVGCGGKVEGAPYSEGFYDGEIAGGFQEGEDGGSKDPFGFGDERTTDAPAEEANADPTTSTEEDSSAGTFTGGGSAQESGDLASSEELIGQLPDCDGSCSGCDPESGICYIQCVGDSTCIQADLVCPEGSPCVVLCKGTRACIQADVICPSGASCALSCNGDSTCSQLSLHCGDDSCHYSCSGSRSCIQLNQKFDMY